MNLLPIDDVDDPRLDVYRQLRQSNLTRASGLFIAEGKWLVHRLAASRFAVHSIVCGASHTSELPQLSEPHAPIYVLAKADIRRLIGFEFHRGMLACGYRGANPSLQELLSPAQSTLTLAVCPQVVDPTNLGSIVRNSSALGAAGLLLGPGSADPFARRVVRVSMGSVLQLPVRETSDVGTDLHTLRHAWGFELVATVLDPTAESLPQATRGPRVALLFGQEGHGLAPLWIEQCDRRVTLQMHRNTDSLNLATATGIFLYHFATVAPIRERG